LEEIPDSSDEEEEKIPEGDVDTSAFEKKRKKKTKE